MLNLGERRDAFACFASFASREGTIREIHINGSGVPASDAKKNRQRSERLPYDAYFETALFL